MSSGQPSTEHAKPPFVPRTIWRLAVPVILLWLLIVLTVPLSSWDRRTPAVSAEDRPGVRTATA